MDCPKRMCDTEAAVGLPDDPLVEILSRIPVKSLCRFKCVSKAWRDLIADPLHRKKLPQTLEGFFFTGVEHRDSDSGGDGCSSDYGDGEHGGTDGSDGDDCGSVYGDGEHGGTDASDGEESLCPFYVTDVSDGEQLPHQFYGFFDVLKRSVRAVDFSYLTELPGPAIVKTRLLDCCNGLLLFVVHYNTCISRSYIVCNPATKQCVAAPSSGLTWDQMFSGSTVTYLLFDPGVRWNFNLVQFFVDGYKTSVHAYSSKTQAWSHNKRNFDLYHTVSYSPGVYVNVLLHLLSYLGRGQLTVVDVEGNIETIIFPPCHAGTEMCPSSCFIGQSQGCLYFIYHGKKIIWDGFGSRGQIWDGLLIWVFEDYDRQQWVLKDSVSFLKLFGRRKFHMDSDYNIVGIHPDHSLVFLVWNQKLISYHMDSKEVRDLCTFGHGCKCITPYVPYFSELVLENKQ